MTDKTNGSKVDVELSELVDFFGGVKAEQIALACGGTSCAFVYN